MSTNELLQVPEEFTKQSLEYAKLKRPRSKGGRVPKHVRDARRDDVRRLHLDYGYPARKIARMMNVSRHTINGDIDYLYSNVFQKVNTVDPASEIIVGIEQWKIQMTSLREELDKTTNHSERMSIQRLIFDIRCKIIHTYQRLAESTYRINKIVMEQINSFLEENKIPKRCYLFSETALISENANMKVRKIITDDWQNQKIKRKRN